MNIKSFKQKEEMFFTFSYENENENDFDVKLYKSKKENGWVLDLETDGTLTEKELELVLIEIKKLNEKDKC